ncbi:MAG: hypothetical protein A2051_04560 [Desulfovibrionales bacterium GWA2_65_9]|nr:MAG: hypothetical protein A2051_04560 [Desulfovibrionales bacterium GWA2_65_9]
MNRSAPPSQQALAAPLPVALLGRTLALALAVALFSPCAPALASGALPWLAPGQQDNASATGSNATTAASRAAPGKPAVQPAAPATSTADAAAKAQIEVLRQYFRRQLTLAEDFPEVFSRRVKDSETMAFMTMCEMQRKRGLLARFRTAEVDLSGLTFTRMTADPDLARIRVTGRYSFVLGPKALVTMDPKAQGSREPTAQENAGARVHETLEEDALFVLLPEMGQWKIFERRGDWRP